jgi:DNA-binding NarL/FixJ family response regulator
VGAAVIRVLLADDQRIVRDGLTMLLGRLPGLEVVGAAVDGEDALAMAGQLRPDVILMDLRMPRCDGVEAIRRLRDERHPAPVIALTTYADDRSVLDALRAGARGYLTKDAGAADIERAVHAVLAGGAALDPAVQHHLVDALRPVSVDPDVSVAGGPLPAGLTRREAEVLALIAAGLSNQEIAGHLHVAETTVKTHVNHILTKTGVRDRAQAVAYAYRTGLADPRGR